jgi:predicted secreted Zn-dependent protease
MIRPTLALVLAACLHLSSSALAKDQSQVATYWVNGKNAKEIYDSIRSNGPKVVANMILAYTAIATKTEQDTAVANGKCRFTIFRTSAIFIFNLPQHRKPALMPAALRGRWDNFVAYLLHHEEGHREIWRACLKDYDARALALSAKTCEKLEQDREKLFTSIKRGCIAQDEAYDVVFRKEVLKEPFVAEALKAKHRNGK